MNGRDRIDLELARFPAGSMTHRFVTTIVGHLPDAPPVPAYTSFVGVGDAVFPGLDEATTGRARGVADEMSVDRAMFLAKSIDTGDTGLSIVTGVRTALGLFGMPGAATARTQQRADLALKALGMACLLVALLPKESPAGRVARLGSVPAGRHITSWFAAVEVALPLGDEVGAASTLNELVGPSRASTARKLAKLVGKTMVGEATATLDAWLPALEGHVRVVRPSTKKMAETVAGLLPRVPPDLHGVLATAADALPAYRYLTARLAAELCFALARGEVAAPAPPPLPAGLAAATATPVAEGSAPVIALAPTSPELVPADEDALPDEFDDAPDPGSTLIPDGWPDLPLPPELRMTGAWVAPDGRWLCFRPEGLVLDAPPADLHPDWDEHAAAGHRVGRYSRLGPDLEIAWPGAPTVSTPYAQGDYTLTAFGEIWARADFDLTDRWLDGTWSGEGASITLRPDGAFRSSFPDLPDEGRYRLGAGGVAFVGVSGDPVSLPLLTTLTPSAATPDALWLGGRGLRRA